MKRFRNERLYAELISFLLAALFIFPLEVLCERIVNRRVDWYTFVLHSWPLLLCFIGGRLAEKQDDKMRLLYGIVSTALAGGFICLIIPHEYNWLLFTLLSLAVGAGMFVLGTKSGLIFPSKAAIASIIMYLAELVVFTLGYMIAHVIVVFTTMAFINFVLCLYSFNANSLYVGMHRLNDNSFRVPSGIRGKNMLLLSIFLILAVFFASLRPVRDLIGDAAFGILSVIAWFINRGSSGGDSAAPEEESGGAVETIEIGADIPPFEWADKFVTGLMVFISITVIVMIVAIVVYFFNGDGSHRGLRRSRSRRSYNSEDYEDEEESLFDLKDILNRRRESVKKLVEKINKRPERFEDMPDNRMKLRFAYRELLRSGLALETAAADKTPSELVPELSKNPEVQQMTKDYIRARYSAEDIEDSAAENARVSLGKFKVRRRKK